jgi:hypothetical protein
MYLTAAFLSTVIAWLMSEMLYDLVMMVTAVVNQNHQPQFIIKSATHFQTIYRSIDLNENISLICPNFVTDRVVLVSFFTL